MSMKRTMIWILLVICGQIVYGQEFFNKGKVALSGRVKDLTATKGFRLVARGVPEALQTELSGTREGEAVTFLFPALADANSALDKLRAAGGVIETLVQTSSTLEEVFVRTVNG